jgi:hypothetical protein
MAGVTTAGHGAVSFVAPADGVAEEVATAIEGGGPGAAVHWTRMANAARSLHTS